LLISHQPAVLFSQNKPAINNQPAVLFSQNKSAPAISHQPNEQAGRRRVPFHSILAIHTIGRPNTLSPRAHDVQVKDGDLAPVACCCCLSWRGGGGGGTFVPVRSPATLPQCLLPSAYGRRVLLRHWLSWHARVGPYEHWRRLSARWGPSVVAGSVEHEQNQLMHACMHRDKLTISWTTLHSYASNCVSFNSDLHLLFKPELRLLLPSKFLFSYFILLNR
jgi:hypothetical protein